MKNPLIVTSYIILPWLYGGINHMLNLRTGVLSGQFTHQILLQTMFPVFFALNLALFLCLLTYLNIKILEHIKHHCIVSVLGVAIYPLSYYLILLLNYTGADIRTLTNVFMKAMPFLYIGDRLSLTVLLAISLVLLIFKLVGIKGFLYKKPEE